eukprot:TRINITY_DN5001_c0_g1_i1.p1 TRINITY_DN5001_c0_g1~~TRINITY_DN5001_c0_g1_i1.p1  ORF type:complete len:131 (-),score=32.67 TRINITY_DN5001_c0_g1_i1:302-694(-)
MRFCSECNNLLYPREALLPPAAPALVYECRLCHHLEHNTGAHRVYRRVHRMAEQGVQDDDDDAEEEDDPHRFDDIADDLTDDPTLPRTRLRCQKCGPDAEAVFFQLDRKGVDSGMTLLYICRGCKHKWVD